MFSITHSNQHRARIFISPPMGKGKGKSKGNFIQTERKPNFIGLFQRCYLSSAKPKVVKNLKNPDRRINTFCQDFFVFYASERYMFRKLKVETPPDLPEKLRVESRENRERYMFRVVKSKVLECERRSFGR